MQWWCAASSAEWSWAWRAYPGVWLLVLGLGAAYLRGVRPRHPLPTWRAVSFATGLLVLWLALDWPVGALGAGYLLSVHTAQYVVLTLVASPLLLLGLPPGAWPGAATRRGALLRRLAHPGAGLLGYTVVMGVTHVPAVADRLMAFQLGSLAIDLAWLGGAFFLWWPVLAPAPFPRMSPPLRIGYLFAATIPPIVPAAFMVFADYPLYGLFELAPRVHGITAAADQQAAGLIMKVGADPLLWIAMAVVFFRWQREEDALERDTAAKETRT